MEGTLSNKVWVYFIRFRYICVEIRTDFGRVDMKIEFCQILVDFGRFWYISVEVEVLVDYSTSFGPCGGYIDKITILWSAPSISQEVLGLVEVNWRETFCYITEMPLDFQIRVGKQ